MSTLLPTHAHCALVARWAWYAYTDVNAPGHELLLDRRRPTRKTSTEWDRASIISAIELAILDYTERLISDPPRREQPVEAFSDQLLGRIRRRVNDDDSGQLNDVLDGYRQYLKMLIGPNLDPLHRLICSTLNATITAYRHFGVDVPDSLDLDVQLVATATENPPRRTFPSPLLGDAKVYPGCLVDSCCAERQQHIMTLRVDLAPASFDRPTLAALPFTLFHECVSHILQGPWELARVTPDAGSQFAEGWMDRAAWEIFNVAVTRKAPLKQLVIFPYPIRREFYLSGGQRMYNARHRTLSPSEQQYEFVVEASRRYEGWAAADLVVETLGSLDIADGDLLFLQMSLAINASEVAPLRRDKFAQVLWHGLRPKTPPRESERAHLLWELGQYALSGDVRRLLASVLDR